MKKLGLIVTLSLLAMASASSVDSLKELMSNPQGQGFKCSSMSYGISCRGVINSVSSEPISIQWKGKNQYIVTISKSKLTFKNIAPSAVNSARGDYKKITSGAFKNSFIRELGSMIIIRSSGALNGLY